ncbi:MAG TPA: GNAT family N-acetyltransferase [Streptosporangiaceae bacterium]|nr:GNAT family N-acetyltransferase [Streptosporangiaceae bacterium]
MIVPDLLYPYQAVADATERPAWWPDRAADPRQSLGWARGTRRDGDSLWFAGAPDGPALWTRWITGDGVLPRMNAVDVCAGLVAGVEADPVGVAEARAASHHQVVLAANGYVSPLITAGPASDGEVQKLLAEVVRAATDAGAVPSVLHCSPGDPLLGLLPDLGFVTGITDLYAVIDLPGDSVEDYLAALPGHRRQNVRREMRALEQGGRGRIVFGADAQPHLADACELAAQAYLQRGDDDVPLAEIVEVYRRLLAGVGDDFALCLVEVDGVPVASCCLVTGESDILAYSAGMRNPQAREVAGYFNACYYLPIELAYRRGAKRLLIGPMALEAKRLRGAEVVPVLSAVPRTCAPLARLLAATDEYMRKEWESLPA